MNLPFKVEVRGRASSHYTAKMIRDRLKKIRHRKDEASKAEVAYLNNLLSRSAETEQP
jgi:hypothetical protein